MEHLATLDAAFSALDDDHNALNIASVGVFAGPPAAPHDFAALVRRKLHLVPRMRQVLRPVPLGLARAAWVDDEAFDLRRHLQHTTIAAPGRISDLEQIVGEFVSVPLDPARPLWQVLLVDGLSEDRWAIVTKIHHSVLDGVGGLALIGRLLDTTADATLPPPTKWRPEHTPGRSALLRSALRTQTRAVRSVVGAMVRLSVHPRDAAREARATAAGLSALRAGIRRTVPTSLSGSLGTTRAYLTGQLTMTDIDTVRSSLGGTVNDVVLALVTAAERAVIVARHERPRPHEVHCLVPVSLRGHGPADPAGNRVSGLIIDLPVEFGDPLARYEAVLARVREGKRAHEAEAGAELQIVLDALPPPLVSAAVRAAASVPQHFLTTVVTNVPGSPQRLYALGRPLLEHYPYVPIADQVRAAVALTSYEGRIFFGITADQNSMPDAAALRDAIQQELENLTEVARAGGNL